MLTWICSTISSPPPSLSHDTGFWLLVEPFRQTVQWHPLQHPQAGRPGRSHPHGRSTFQVTNNADSLTLIITLLVVAGICVVALFASGALMSAGKLDYTLALTIHRTAPVVMIIALGLVVYLLGWKS